MDPAAWTVIGGVSVAIITAIVSPVLVKRLESRDPARGWQAAVEVLQQRLTDQDSRIDSLEAEVKELEDEVRQKDSVIRDRDRTIEGQSKTIAALVARVTQLESAWPPGLTLPPIDPAFRSVLQSRTGGA